MPFIELKDVTLDPRFVLAIGKMTIPQTLQTPEMYGISVWISDVREPIVITYEDEEERNAQLVLIKKGIEALEQAV